MLPFVVSLSLIFFIINKFRRQYIEKNKTVKIFIVYITLFYIRIQGLLISNSPLILIFAWERLGITSFFLVLYYYNWNRFQGASLTLISNRWGDCFLVRRIFIFGTINFYVVLILLIMITTKRAIFPFRSWLPAAIAAPTPTSALVHSRTLVTSGIVLNFKFKICYLNLNVKTFLMIFGTVSILLGSLRALIRVDLKKIVAFTTISQIGILLFSWSAIRPALTLCYLLRHAYLKVWLFILRGNLITMNARQNFYKFPKINIKFKIWSSLIVIIMNFISWFCLSICLIKELLIIFVNKCTFSSIIWQTLIVIIGLTCLYSFRFFIIFTSEKRPKRFLKQMTKLSWCLVIIIISILIKMITFYIKDYNKFSIITIRFTLIILFIIFYFSVTIKLIIIWLYRANNFILLILSKIKLIEDGLIFSKIIVSLNVPSKILVNLKFYRLGLIILVCQRF